MKKILIVLFFSFQVSAAFCTCIAIYIAENGYIYVAADSRRSFFFNDAGNPHFDTVCKIHNVGHNYFAISGIDDGSLLTAANTVLKQDISINLAIKQFGETMSKHYKKLMDDTRLFFPAKFPKFLRDGLASVSFFGYYCGLPNVYNIDFLCSLDKTGQIVIRYRITRIFDINVIGITQDIANAPPGLLPAPEIKYEAPELYVEALVKIEAKMHPLSVSAPIDVLELKPDGEVWVRKNKQAVSY